MSCRLFFLAVLSLTLGGCAVYDYDNDYYGRRYHGDDDYQVHRYYYDSPRPTYRIVDQRYYDQRYDDRRYYDRRDHDGRKDYYRQDNQRYDKRYHDNDRKNRHDKRYYQPRQDDFQERRHDYTPRLQTWGQNNVRPDHRQPGYRASEHRQQYRVQSGHDARPHDNPRYNDRSDWSMQNHR